MRKAQGTAFQIRHFHGGVVLLLVLGILALLSVLALAFVNLTALERTISTNYVHKTQSQMAAESGVDYAISRIYGFKGGTLRTDEIEDMAYDEALKKASFQMPEFQAPLVVPGAEKAISGFVGGAGASSTGYFALRVEDESGKLNINDSNGLWNIDNDPLPDSEDSSIDTDVLEERPRLQHVFDVLVERVTDTVGALAAISLFNARAKLPGDMFSDWSQVEAALIHDAGMSQSDYAKLKAHITLGSWQDPNVIRPTFKLAIGSPVDPPVAGTPEYDVWEHAKFNLYIYSDFQTHRFELEPRSPVNVNTCSKDLLIALISPVTGWYLYEGEPSSLMDGVWGPWVKSLAASSFSWVDYMHTNGYTTEPLGGWGFGSASQDWTLGNGNRYGEARQSTSFETIEPLSGQSYAEVIAEELFTKIHGLDVNNDGDFDDAAEIAPQPFRTWDEFSRFVYEMVDPAVQISTNVEWGYAGTPFQHDLTEDEEAKRFPYRLPVTGAPNGYSGNEGDRTLEGFDRYMADALLANFDPNSRLNDFNPDFHIFRHTDKSQLIQYSTELSFQPTGVFQIESQGYVESEAGEVLAKTSILSTVNLFHLLRQTTQQQFMGRAENGGYDKNDHASIYHLFRETEGSFPTSGADLEQGSGNLAPGGSWGPCLTSYPEPIRVNKSLSMDERPDPANPTSLYKFPLFSKYDGFMMLSTWQRNWSAYPEDDGGDITYVDVNGDGVSDDLDPPVPIAPAKPRFLAPMGYRWIGDPSDVAAQTDWRNKTLAIGGMYPMVFGQNPEVSSDELDTMDVPESRGVMLAWNEDHTKMQPWPPPSGPGGSGGNFGDGLPAGPIWGLYFFDVRSAKLARRQNPIPQAFRHDTPWVNYTKWNPQYLYHNDHLSDPLDFGYLRSGPDIEGWDNITAVREDNPHQFVWRAGWNTPSENPLTPDVPGGQLQGNLYPDGAFSEMGRQLAYKSTNMGSNWGTQGAVSFWVKPHWDAGYSNRAREFFSMGHRGAKYTHPIDLIYFPASPRPGMGGPRDEVLLHLLPYYGAWVGVASFESSTWPLPTHSFLTGWPFYVWCKAAYLDQWAGVIPGPLNPQYNAGAVDYSFWIMASQTATDFFPYRDDSQRPTHPSLAFYGHQWNHVGLSYINRKLQDNGNRGASIETNTLLLSINGEEVTSKPEGVESVSGEMNSPLKRVPLVDIYWEENPHYLLLWSPNPSLSDPSVPDDYEMQPEPEHNHMGYQYMRFGWGSDNSGAVADSTYDEISTWATPVSPPVYESMWHFGRYHSDALSDSTGNVVPAVLGLYTSPDINPHSELRMNLGAHPVNRLFLHSVNWTLNWPRYNWRPDSASIASSKITDLQGVDIHAALAPENKPMPDPVTGDWDPVTVDIYNPNLTTPWTYSQDNADGSEFNHMDTMLSEAGGSSAYTGQNNNYYSKNDVFRYRVYFHLQENQTLLESPMFDDITFVFIADRPVILSWKVILNG